MNDFDALSDMVPYGILVTDSHGECRKWNRVFAAWLKLDADVHTNAVSQNFNLRDLIDAGCRAFYDSFIVPRLKCGDPITEVELQLVHGSSFASVLLSGERLIESDPPDTIFILRKVTADRHANEFLGQSSEHRQQLAFTASSSRDAIVSSDQSGRIVSWNDTAVTMFGYTRREAIGSLVEDLIIPPSQLAEYRATLHGIAQTETHWLHETIRCNKDRNEFPVEVSASFVRDCYTNTWMLSGIYRDLREREVLNRKILESDMFGKAVLEASPDCVKVINSDGTIEYMNVNGALLLDMEDVSQVIGQRWEDIWPPDSRQTVRSALDLAISGESTRFEAYCPTAKGNKKHWDVLVSPIRSNSSGIRRVVASSRDITRRRSFEIEIKDSRRRLKQAADAASLTYVSADLAKGRIRTASNFWSVMNIDSKDFFGTHRSFDAARRIFLKKINPTNRALVETAFDRIREGAARGKVEYVIICKDGTERHIESSWIIEAIASGTPERLFITNLDITERKTAETQIRSLLREVNHRSKNLLSVVLAVGRQTSRTSTPEQFMDKFSRRIESLSASHDLLVENNWRSVKLTELITAQFAKVNRKIDDRIRLSGPALHISAPAAQSIGLAIHELATNAERYGALSNDRGTVSIRWKQEREPVSLFSIHWEESGGPRVFAPLSSGFGSLVIKTMVESAVLGHSDLSYSSKGLSWKLSAPEGMVVESQLAASASKCCANS